MFLACREQCCFASLVADAFQFVNAIGLGRAHARSDARRRERKFEPGGNRFACVAVRILLQFLKE
jgi:hypothetical protein